MQENIFLHNITVSQLVFTTTNSNFPTHKILRISPRLKLCWFFHKNERRFRFGFLFRKRNETKGTITEKILTRWQQACALL